MCDLVKGDIVMLFCHRRIAGQLLDCDSGFLASVCNVNVSDEVLPGSSLLLR